MGLPFNTSIFYHYFKVRLYDQSLAIPHFSVSSINDVNPGKLKECGFKGVIFDKDETLMGSYSKTMPEQIKAKAKEFEHHFGQNLLVVSNTAGTGLDRRLKDAKKLEAELGWKVLVHKRMKPSTLDGVLEYFGCESHELVMIGDSILTDVVFGNRQGMLTIHTQGLTKESKATMMLRNYENRLLKKWREAGVDAPKHTLYHKDVVARNLF